MKILAKGISMFPTLMDGMVYKVKPYRRRNIYVGDIVVFKIEDYFICHRVIQIIQTGKGEIFYKTNGDNCTTYDSYAVKREMIIGKIVI